MTLSVQFMTMAAMALMGLWIGVSVDTYGRLFYRGPRRRWNIIQMTGDLVFWLLQGLLVFLVLLYVNHGSVRIYIFLALLCGYAAYRSLFQTLYRRMLDVFIQSVLFIGRLIINIFRHLFVRPVQWLLQLGLFLGKIVVKGILAILFYAAMVVWVPFRGLAVRVLPDRLLQNLKKVAAVGKRYAGIVRKVKNIKGKLVTWFSKMMK